MRVILKWLIRVAGATLGLLILAVLGFIFWPVQAYVPELRNPKAASTTLTDRVGWYDFGGGVERLISFGETDGITLNRFDSLRSSLEQRYFDQSTDLVFLGAGSASSTERLEFRLEEGRVSGLIWTSSGEECEAVPRRQPPYTVEEVLFPSANISLSGLLLRPTDDTAGPAVVFVHGSGVSHRNIFWYLSQADYFAHNGITVLLPDKRGAGKSEGTWHDASLHDYAQDAVAAIRFLEGRREAPAPTVGLIGISQGAWVAPLAAKRKPMVHFVISVSGSLRRPSEQLAYEIQNDIEDSGAPRLVAKLLGPLAARRAMKRQPAWWGKNGTFDPIGDWQALKRPTLFVFGEDDRNVDVAANLARLRSTGLDEAPHVEIQVLEGLGHAMMDEDTGWVDQDYLSRLVNWINSRRS